MHELSIAESILDAVREELLKHPGARPARIGLRIGELAAVDVDSLTFCFEAVLHDTDWESLKLDIRVCKQRGLCKDCGKEFDVVDYITRCPACAGSNTTVTGGDELDFDYLEVETHETPAVEVKSAE
jgi:hydrogenase nickel incorporation protein HypA/HybF